MHGDERTMPAVVKAARGEGRVELRQVPTPVPGPGQVMLAVAVVLNVIAYLWAQVILRPDL